MSSLDENNLGPSSEYQENLDILRQTYFFSGLPLESLKVFAYLCTRAKFKSGDALFNQGEDDGDAFCLISGKAQLERTVDSTRFPVRVLGPGEFIGGLSLLGETRRLYSLRALEDTICLVLSREKFSKTLQQFTGQMPRIFKAVVSAINRWEEHFLEEMPGECGGCTPRMGVSLL
ncbi:MAG TPA: cyclic nucleotide-binding domain-containing protein [Desulfobacterales bacterium]|jgi:CRP/FNR family transcriptional regulator, cyclic AMP receptor protein|nr:cyclic nucleotide-binding domain-containing protein [Desulfobacterales bacterium]HSM88773.1 cyclic nucleotide-binding domain-containing protein [Desulfobacterales bacterium]